jgi:hypothetical protein
MTYNRYGLVSKKYSNLENEDIIRAHLAPFEWMPLEDAKICSTLEVALTALAATSVNIRTKTLAHPMVAFSILDQIGGAYYIIDNNTIQQGSSIEQALHNFCDIPWQSDDSYALYALRNSLLHDACLTSNLKKGNSVKHYYFWYSEDFDGVVRPAKVAWSGDPDKISDENVTYINPKALRVAVEFGVNKLREKFDQDASSVATKISPSEIRINYLRWIYT